MSGNATGLRGNEAVLSSGPDDAVDRNWVTVTFHCVSALAVIS